MESHTSLILSANSDCLFLAPEGQGKLAGGATTGTAPQCSCPLKGHGNNDASIITSRPASLPGRKHNGAYLSVVAPPANLRRASGALALIIVAVTVGLFSAQAQKRTVLTQKLPVIYWAQGIETAPALKQAGVEQIAAPPDKAQEWAKAGFGILAISQQELEQREKLLVPRTAGRADVASATRRPWIDSNGWRFVRNPAGKFYYDLPLGKATLASAEAYSYRADAILKIDPADLAATGKMLAFLRALPLVSLPPVADIGLIDDGSAVTGEVMNLLTRRNLLFKLVPKPAPQFRVNIKLGGKDYSQVEAADPSAFALKVRRQLGDDNRSLRIYGTEVVIGRLTAGGERVRLHLLNYSGRDVDSLRVRLRGKYGKGDLKVFGAETSVEDFVVADGATEFTIPRMGVYAMIELPAVK